VDFASLAIQKSLEVAKLSECLGYITP